MGMSVNAAETAWYLERISVLQLESHRVCTHVHIHAHVTGFLPQVIRGEMREGHFQPRLLPTALQTELGCLWGYNHGPKQVSGTAGGQTDFLESDNSRKAGWRKRDSDGMAQGTGG